MVRNILLYGATGYSGRLIVDELKLYRDACPNDYQIVLAGRNAQRLKAMADKLDMDFRAFDLSEEAAIAQALRDADVVINAAGPCAWTAPQLAHAAQQADCSYVDINGEPDVYQRLWRDHTNRATVSPSKSAVVCGAGFWAAASNLLLDQALSALKKDGIAIDELASIRIGMSRILTFSRGSAETVLRSLRQQAIVLRPDPIDRRRMKSWPEPVGRLERSFNFSPPSTKEKANRCIASCASLVDTLAARFIIFNHEAMAGTVESYVEAGAVARLAYQAGSVLSPLIAFPALRDGLQRPLAILANGPTEQERKEEPHQIVLEIELPDRSLAVDWLWQTPNVYQFTAQLVSAVADQLAVREPRLAGWIAPALALRPLDLPLTVPVGATRGATRGCTWYDRSHP